MNLNSGVQNAQLMNQQPIMNNRNLAQDPSPLTGYAQTSSINKLLEQQIQAEQEKQNQALIQKLIKIQSENKLLNQQNIPMENQLVQPTGRNVMDNARSQGLAQKLINFLGQQDNGNVAQQPQVANLAQATQATP